MRRRLKRYLTAGGRTVLGLLLISVLAGSDPYRTHLDGMFVVVLALFLVAFFIGVFYGRRLRGDWRVPVRVVAGGKIPVSVSLTNLSSRPAYEVEAAFDQLPRGLWQRVEDPGENRCDRILGGDSATLQLNLRADRRGAYVLGPVFAGVTFPFGIFRFASKLPAQRRVLVTPRIHPILSLELNPGLRYQPGGVPMASETGESLEFMGVREYRQGDSLRKIHWKLWARQGKPVVREFSQEYFSRVGVVLDTYNPPKGPEFEAATEVAASIATFLARQDAIVDFFAAGPDVYFLSVGRQLGALQSILDVLACVEPSDVAPYEKLEHQLLDILSGLSAVVVITFALDKRRREFLDKLRLGGAPLRVFCIGDGDPEADVTWLPPALMPASLEQL